MKKIFVIFSIIVICGFQVNLESYICDSSTEYVIIGSSPDGKNIAVKEIIFAEDENDGVDCSYPLIKGRRQKGINLLLYQYGKEYTKKWAIYNNANIKQKCTSFAQAKKQLSQAKMVFKEAEINLNSTTIPLKGKILNSGFDKHTTKKRYLIPKNIMEKYAVKVPVSITLKKREIETHMPGVRYSLIASGAGYGNWLLDSFDCHSYCTMELLPVFLVGDSQSIAYNYIVFCGSTRYKFATIADIAAHLFNARGYKYHKQKKYKASESDFKQAFKLNPGYGQAAFNLACAQALLGKKEAAFQSLSAAIKNNPKLFIKKARKDPDFKLLRSDKRFYFLINQVQNY